VGDIFVCDMKEPVRLGLKCLNVANGVGTIVLNYLDTRREGGGEFNTNLGAEQMEINVLTIQQRAKFLFKVPNLKGTVSPENYPGFCFEILGP
jgi:hypothetical protein